MVDIKSKRKFLKRTRTDTITQKLLFIGSSFNLHGRQLTVVDFANDHTRARLGRRLEKSCLVIYDVNEVATALQGVAKAGLQVAAAQMISSKVAADLGLAGAWDTCVVVEVVGSEALALVRFQQMHICNPLPGFAVPTTLPPRLAADPVSPVPELRLCVSYMSLSPAQTESIARNIPGQASPSAGDAQDLILACFGAGSSLPNTVPPLSRPPCTAQQAPPARLTPCSPSPPSCHGFC